MPDHKSRSASMSAFSGTGSSTLFPGKDNLTESSLPEIKPTGFTVLNPGVDPVTADVVFVHGLGGHPETSWTKRLPKSPSDLTKSGRRRLFSVSFSSRPKLPQVPEAATNYRRQDSVYWPSELLPQTVNGIRILTYGYDSKFIRLFQTVSNNGIVQHAGNLLAALVRIRGGLDSNTRPIIFVAHSFGGILVKEVLRQSQANEFQEEKLLIARDTHGVVFLGCPHRGATAAEWGKILSNIATFAMQSPNKSVIRSLSRFSDMLQITSDSFSVLLKRGGLKVHSFYEEHGLSGIPGFTGKVVEDSSALIGDAAERKEGINADHREMIRYGSLDDDGYIKVAGVIQGYVEEIKAKSPALQGNKAQGPALLSNEEIECRRLFYISDYATKLSSIPKQQPGTCKWVTTHPRFEQWRYSPRQPMIWLSGNPGCGKSVISAFLVEHFQTDLDQTVLYFFCDSKDETLKTTQTVLRSLLHQLFSLKPKLLRHAIPSYKQMKNAMIESTGTLWKILRSAVSDAESGIIFCFLDGLDECDPESQKSILNNFSQLFPLPTSSDEDSPTNFTKLKVFVTSRPWPFIERGFYDVPHIRLRSENEEAINTDIQIFIHSKVENLAYMRGYTEEVKRKVLKTLVQKSSGMFLWVALVVEQLSNSPSDRIEECLLELPNDLYGVYEQILKNIGSNIRALGRVKEILLWVVTALRPLTVEELAFACSIDQDKGRDAESIDLEARSAQIGADVRLCEPILSIRNGVVGLVHQSVKDFFVGHSTPFSRDFYPHTDVANLGLAEMCITYLSHFSFSDGALNMRRLTRNEEIFEERLSKHPLLRYSAASWLQHIQQAKSQQKISDKFTSAFFVFVDESLGYFNSWVQTWWFLRESHAEVPFHITPLHFLSYLAESPFAIILLNHASSVLNAPDSSGQTPLHWACKAGSDSAVKLLLSKDVKVTMKDGIGRMPLHVASSSGSVSTVALLLEHKQKLNPNIRDRMGRTPLLYAAAAGATDVLKLLLSEGADIHATQPIIGCSVLQEATSRGADEAVLLLLKEGADINRRDYKGWTALHWAAAVDSQSTAKVLLDHGADVMALSNHGSTALRRAAWAGSLETARLLLERGVDGNRLGGKVNTSALHNAAWQGSEPITRLLLDWGCVVDILDDRGRTPLHDAAWRGSEETVRLLLERGADIHAVTKQGRTVLHEAAWRGSIGTVRLLFDSGLGADSLSTRDTGGRNPLHEAAWRGSEEVIRLFLEMSVDPDYINIQSGPEPSGRGRTALHEAATSSSVAALRLLLRCGADIKMKDFDGRNALYWAGEGAEESTRILLREGIEVSTVDKSGRTALHWACEKGTEGTVKLLVNNNIDVSLVDKDGRTALHQAALRGSAVIAGLLVNKTDLATQDNQGRSVLHNAVKSGSDVLVRLLIKAGADRTLRDKDGHTAIDLAKSDGVRAVFKELDSVVV